eukprot:TRINITY_DN20957_c0_g1_i3.p1 TRINITY_DN20957_c0_g1~~TRINITY_DN20957_c0_g1_i3.p1  ORF type:complete len:109 (-),score=13.79 TRINITY_DN20957_c0_g1_i3:31-357(-)
MYDETEHRSTAVALVTCTNWVGNYIIAFITPVLMDAIHFNTFFVFAAFCALASLLSLWLPETKGVPLEDMPQLFGPKLGERYVGQGGLTQGVADKHVPDYSALREKAT